MEIQPTVYGLLLDSYITKQMHGSSGSSNTGSISTLKSRNTTETWGGYWRDSNLSRRFWTVNSAKQNSAIGLIYTVFSLFHVSQQAIFREHDLAGTVICYWKSMPNQKLDMSSSVINWLVSLKEVTPNRGSPSWSRIRFFRYMGIRVCPKE